MSERRDGVVRLVDDHGVEHSDTDATHGKHTEL